MLPEEQNQIIPVTQKTRKRPILCSLILAMALTYFLILFLLFLAALIFSGDITRTISYYSSEQDFKASGILWFVFTGLLLYLASSAGIILMMLRRKSGFFLFVLSALVIFLLDFLLLDFDWLRYLIHSGFIFLVGILHFSGRCYRQTVSTADKTGI
jgi:hypothetical protein